MPNHRSQSVRSARGVKNFMVSSLACASRLRESRAQSSHPISEKHKTFLSRCLFEAIASFRLSDADRQHNRLDGAVNCGAGRKNSMSVALSDPPEPGQLVNVRSRRWVVNEVNKSAL